VPTGGGDPTSSWRTTLGAGDLGVGVEVGVGVGKGVAVGLGLGLGIGEGLGVAVGRVASKLRVSVLDSPALLVEPPVKRRSLRS